MTDLASCGGQGESDTVRLVRKKIWADSKDHLYHLMHPTSITSLKLLYLTSVCPSEIYQGKLGMSVLSRNYRTTVLRAPRLLLYWKLRFYCGSFNTLSTKMNKPHNWPLTTIPHFSKTVPRIAAVHCPPKDSGIPGIHNCLLIWKLLWHNL